MLLSSAILSSIVREALECFNAENNNLLHEKNQIQQIYVFYQKN
jgi:hypothetical protein